MIYTSYFAQLRNLPENVIPISICAKAPEWYKGLQYKKLAPKFDFFMKWKENHDNDYYIKCFNEQVLNNLDKNKVLIDLQLMLPYEIRENMDDVIWNSKNHHIALICYEKPSDFCHRHLVSQWLRDAGLMCNEYKQ